MEITEEILTIKEFFEIIREGFKIGELAEVYMKNKHKQPCRNNKNGFIAGEIRVKNKRLETTQKLEKLVEELIDNCIDPLKHYISNELVIKEYKKQLKEFLKNIDKKITIINTICPLKNVQKHILLYLVSTQALKIYYEIRENGEYKPSPKKDENYIKYDDKRNLPFDIDEIPNSFQGIIIEKNLKLSQLMDDKRWNKHLNNNGISISPRFLADEEDNYLGHIKKFSVDCLFKRVQWDAYNELKNIEGGDQFITILQKTMSGVLNLSTDMSCEEAINFSFNKIFEEIGKADNVTDPKKLEKVKEQFDTLIKLGLEFVKQIEINPELMMELMKPMVPFFKPLELKNKISVKKLEGDKFHGELIKIHREYNNLKENYSLNGHKKLYSDKLKKFINSNNKYYKGYFSYFIFDSIYLIENNLEEFKGSEKQTLQKLNKKFEEVSKYRCSKNYWNGKKIDYLDYYLTSLLMDKPVEGTTENYSPQFMETALFFRDFSTDESFEKIKQQFIEYKKYIEKLIIHSFEELNLEPKEIKELLEATCTPKN